MKDNICVAGVPMMNGSRVLEGYVPEVDATSSPILDAGVIAGKAACESLLLGRQPYLRDRPIRNPHNRSTTGGSWRQRAALVAAAK